MRLLSGTPIMAVVKADGFGLGAIDVAMAAIQAGAAELGVSTPAEGIALRSAGIRTPILAWTLHDDELIPAAVRHRIRLSPTRVGQLARIADVATGLGIVAEVEIEVETGMHRSGAMSADWDALFSLAAHSPSLRLIGIWTHLAGDLPEHFDEPLDRLDDAHRLARRHWLRPRRHAAASVAATIDPRTRLDVVRLGASLMGIEPVPAEPLGLRPVARWRTTVSQVREARAGDRVGYGRERLDRKTRLALLPVGYADGLPRRAPASGPSRMSPCVGGVRRPFLGTVSMDHSVIDLGDAEAKPGDAVVLFGDPDLGEPGIDEWALELGTIPQEILTGLGPRVARTAVDA